MSTAVQENGRLYRLAPIDKTGVFFGLSVVQIAFCSVGLLSSAFVLIFLWAPLGIVGIPATLALGCLRKNGEAVLHQLPLMVRFVKRGKKETTWHKPMSVLGTANPSKNGPVSLETQLLHHIDPAQYGLGNELRGPVAMVIDKKAGSYAVTMRIAGRQFGLLERHEQDYQLSKWGDILGQFVKERPLISQVQWSEWAAPSGMAEHRDWLEQHKSNQPLPNAVEAWEELLAQTGQVATRHEVLVTITTQMARVRVQKRHMSRHAAAVEALLKETRTLLMHFGGAGLRASVLTPMEHNRAMRLRLDPSSRANLDRREAFLGTAAGFVSDANAGPMAIKESWGWVAADNSLHRSFFVAEWPRLDLPGDWMRTLLLWSGVVRNISVFFQPVPRSKSQRAITAQATKIDADVEHRTDKGFRVGAHHRRARQAVNEREEELVAGYVELAFGGIITISASSMDELDQASADITQIAAGVGVELRVLNGRHSEAMVACLPVARGVRNKLGM